MPDADYYVTATYGPYTRGQAQNVKWELEALEVWMASKDEVSVVVKHAAD